MVRDNRSLKARIADMAVLSETVHPNTSEGRRKWRRNKNRSDLMGVDTPDAFNDLVDADFDFEGEFDGMLGMNENMRELERKRKDVLLDIL